MSERVGVWIDHRRAVVVRVSEEGAVTRAIESGVSPRARAGGSRTSVPFGPQDAFAEGRAGRRHEQALAGFYRSVSEALGDPRQLYVMGPGEAKGELVKALPPALRERVVAVDAADAMTDPQMAARVRAYFGVEAPRGPG